MSQPVKIFISYARKDAAFKDELLMHLKPLVRQNIISSWHDSEVELGDKWEPDILNHLRTADVILFLISPAFMASDYIHTHEIQEAEKRYQQGRTKIVPIWIKEVGYESEFLKPFQALPKDRKPVADWHDHDAAWVDVVKQLLKLFEKLNPLSSNTNSTDDDSANQFEDSRFEVAFNKTYIRDLISKSRTKDALKRLLDHTADSDSDAHNTLTLLSSRFSEIERNSRLGIVSSSDLQLERNRINMALLSVLDELG